MADTTAQLVIGVVDNASSALNTIFGAITGLNSGISLLTTGFSAVSGAISVTTGIMGSMVQGAIDVSEALLDLAENAAQNTLNLRDMANVAGMAPDQFQALALAAQKVGVSSEQLDTSIRMLDQRITGAANGQKAYVSLFQSLGVAFEDSDGKARSVGDVFADIQSKFATMGASAATTSDAVKLFGRSGAQLITMLQEGPGATEAATKSLNDMGLTISGPVIQAAQAFEAAQASMSVAIGGFSQKLGQDLEPAFTTLFQKIGDMANAILKGINIDKLGATLSDGINAITKSIPWDLLSKAAIQVGKEVIQAVSESVTVMIAYVKEIPWTTVISGAKMAAGMVVDAFVSIRDGIVHVIALAEMLPWDKITAGALFVYQDVVSIFSDAASYITVYLSAIPWGDIADAAVTAFAVMRDGAMLFASYLQSMIPVVISFVTGLINTIYTIWPTVQSVYQSVSAVVSSAGSALVAGANIAFNFILNLFLSASGSISESADTMSKGIVSAITSFRTYMSESITFMLQNWDLFWPAIVDTVSTAMHAVIGVISVISTTVASVGGFIAGIFGSVVKLIGQGIGLLSSFLSSMQSGLDSMMSAFLKIPGIPEWVKDAVASVNDAFKSINDNIAVTSDALTQTGNQVIDGSAQLSTQTQSYFDSLQVGVNNFTDKMGGASDKIKVALSDADGLTQSTNNAAGAATQLNDAYGNVLSNIQQSVGQTQGLFSSLSSGIQQTAQQQITANNSVTEAAQNNKSQLETSGSNAAQNKTGAAAPTTAKTSSAASTATSASDFSIGSIGQYQKAGSYNLFNAGGESYSAGDSTALQLLNSNGTFTQIGGGIFGAAGYTGTVENIAAAPSASTATKSSASSQAPAVAAASSSVPTASQSNESAYGSAAPLIPTIQTSAYGTSTSSGLYGDSGFMSDILTFGTGTGLSGVPGSGSGDSTLALLTPGEIVLSSQDSDFVRRSSRGSSFSGGSALESAPTLGSFGQVSSNNAQANSSPVPVSINLDGVKVGEVLYVKTNSGDWKISDNGIVKVG